MIKVRFAPSPTGYLHVGGARTALFNWLFARSNRGEFILRIEDTDIERCKQKYLESILGSLQWLGLDYDNEIIYQSKRKELYHKFANDLLKQGKAYKATHRQGEENTDDSQKEAIYFKVPQKEIFFYDKVHQKITFDTSTIKDLVLIKSDGFAAYNFACAIDDIDLGISHVIRGDDHISNTPKQLLIYEALEVKPPNFAHLPLILGSDGSRLSKRHGATSVEEFKKKGFLPEALFNYLALLGWSPGGNQEIVSRDKIIQKFSLNKVNKVNAIFDIDKLKWINSNYIKEKPVERLKELVLPHLKEKGYSIEKINDKWLEKILDLYNTRLKTLKDITILGVFFFTDNFPWQEDAVNEYLKNADKNLLRDYKKGLNSLDNFSREKIENFTKDFINKKNISLKKVALPVRVAVTGRSVSPEIFGVMNLLGKEKVISRLEYALENKVG